MKTRKVTENLVVVVLSIFFSLLMIEVLFRAMIGINVVKYPNPDFEKIIHRYSENEGLVYELKPSVSANTVYGPVKTNRYGQRDNEYSLKKPPNTVRICVIGDSVTFGTNLRVEDTYPKILERMLNNRYGDREKFEVINFAVVGYNSYQEEIVLEEKCLPFNPDMVLVGFCLNDDSYTDGLGGLAKEMSPHALGSRLHSKLISYLFYRYERANFEKWNDMAKVGHFFDTLSRLRNSNDFKVLVMVFPYYFKDINAYAEIVKHREVAGIAKRDNLPVIDFMCPWKALDWLTRVRFYNYNDRIHFSKKGMNQVAAGVFEYLQKKRLFVLNWESPAMRESKKLGYAIAEVKVMK